MEIRRFEEKDRPAVSKLMRALIDYHHRLDPEDHKTAEEFTELEDYFEEIAKHKDSAFFVAEENGEVTGYLAARVEDGPSYSIHKKIGVVADVAVDEKYRRQGVAEKLFGAALEWFQKKQLATIELSVYSKNLPAIALWKKLGFQEYKIRMRKNI